MSQNQDARNVFRAAQAAVREAEVALSSFDVFCREQGFNPTRARAVLGSLVGAEEAEKARAQFDEDRQEIERQVAEHAVRSQMEKAALPVGRYKPRRPLV